MKTLLTFCILLIPSLVMPAFAPLTWNASIGAAGYKVHYGTKSHVYFHVVDVGNVTEISIADLSPNTKYFFAVSAYNDDNSIGESGYSNEVSYTTPLSEGAIIIAASKREREPPHVIYSEDFETYAVGDDPASWFDTDKNNSMSQNDILFKIFDIAGNKVFGSNSTENNIHSHSQDFSLPLSFEFTGKMMTTGHSVGVTFLSDYPNSDKYYRLRSYDNEQFHINPHGTIVSGDLNSGINLASGTWYNFKINVIDNSNRIEIKAKVWESTQQEPLDWQIDCYDDSASRLSSGLIGLWSHGPGIKYFDDLEVR